MKLKKQRIKKFCTPSIVIVQEIKCACLAEVNGMPLAHENYFSVEGTFNIIFFGSITLSDVSIMPNKMTPLKKCSIHLLQVNLCVWSGKEACD